MENTLPKSTVTQKEADEVSAQGNPAQADGADLINSKIKDLPKRRRLARDTSFGIQQTLICFATDIFTDPFIGALAAHFNFFKWLNGAHGHDHAHEHTHEKISFMQTVKNLFNEFAEKAKSIPKLFHDKAFRAEYWRQWKSEIAGDLSALVLFVPIRRIFSKPFDALSHGLENLFDKRFDKAGRKALEEWKQHHNADDNDPRYQQRLAEYKDQRAHNIVDSFLLGSLSLILNTVARKAIFKEPGDELNRLTWAQVGAGKLLGVIATIGATLGFKTFAPKASHKVDKFLERKVLGKATGWVDEKLGVKDPEEKFEPSSARSGEQRASSKATVEKKPDSYRQQMNQQRDQSEQVPAGVGGL